MTLASTIASNWNENKHCVLVSSLKVGQHAKTITGDIVIATGRTYKDIPGDCPMIRYLDGRETVMTTMAKVIPVCANCTDALVGHEDEGGGLCRWCKTCVACPEENQQCDTAADR